MNTTSKKLTAIFLVLAIMLSGSVMFNSFKKEKAYALPNNYQPLSGADNIYYFSDSAPSRQSALDSTVGPFVYYDTHYLITPQEFNFMVYTGYFWELTQVEDANVLAIIEFKTTKPDQVVLEKLFANLMGNGVKVMFISSYINEYSFSDEIVNDAYFDSMYCNVGRYGLFLRDSFRNMKDYGGFLTDTALLVDRRYVGNYDSLSGYTLGDLCYNSPTLRRIIQYSMFGWTDEAELYFEEDLFRDLWDLYCDTYFEPVEIVVPDYFSEPDVPLDQYIDAWNAVYEYDARYGFSEEELANYNEQYVAIFNEYYDGIAEELTNNNIHILVNSETNKYIDVLMPFPSEQIFINYIDVLSSIQGIRYLFALAIWPWPLEYEGLLDSIADNLSDIADSYCYEITRFPVYTWFEDEIIYDPDGIPVTIADHLFLFYFECDRFPVEDEDYLDLVFTQKMIGLLWS